MLKIPAVTLQPHHSPIEHQSPAPSLEQPMSISAEQSACILGALVPGSKGNEHITSLQAARLKPAFAFIVGNQTLYASRPFHYKEHKAGFILYTPNPSNSSEFYARPVYLSNSRGVFQTPSHLCPHGYLGKGGSGLSKTETILPWEAQKGLHQLLTNEQSLCARLQSAAIPEEGASEESRVFDQLLTDSPEEFNQSNGLSHNASRIKTIERCKRLYAKIKENPQLRPNFTHVIDHYPITLAYPNPQGLSHALVFHSAEEGRQALTYTFHCLRRASDNELDVRLANVEPRAADLTNFGLKNESYNYDNSGFIEYVVTATSEQIPDEFKTKIPENSTYLVLTHYPGQGNINLEAKQAIAAIIAPFLNPLRTATHSVMSRYAGKPAPQAV